MTAAPESRIPRLEADAARDAAEAAGIPTYVADLNIFRVLLHHPRLARQINNFLGLLLLHGRLDARIRELVIMRIGWQTGSEYEWGQHWVLAQRFGVDVEDLRAVRDWEHHDGFGPAERAALAATDEVLATGAVSAATWARCEEHLGGAEELLELVTAIGGWRLISTVLRSLEVPLEEETPSWPPDGRGPSGGR